MSKLAMDGGEKVRTKPFPGWPVWDESEMEALKGVLESGNWGINNSAVGEFEEKFAAYVGVKHGICVTNGTSSLEISLLAADVGRGNEVIVTKDRVILSKALNLQYSIPGEAEARVYVKPKLLKRQWVMR